jgi:hypothetical protein
MIERVFATASYSLSPYTVPTLITLTVCVWLACFSMMYCAVQADVALWWARAAYAGGPWCGRRGSSPRPARQCSS